MGADSELWTCADCGHRFVTRNIWHSCGNYDLELHFQNKDPLVRQIFDQLVQTAQGFGPVTVYAQKTRIVFQVRTRFAFVGTRIHWLNLNLWLRRRVTHDLLQSIEEYSYRDFGHLFRLRGLRDLDEELVGYFNEAYALGSM